MWRDAKKAFDEQLALNKRQLTNGRPHHWSNIVTYIKKFVGESDDPYMVIDFGCGTGILGHIITNYTPAFYYGLDYSEYAIQLAKENWKVEGLCNFALSDVWRNKSIKLPHNPSVKIIGLANGLLDITDNAEELLDDLLSRQYNAYVLARVHLTAGKAFRDKYEAYGEIETVDSRINDEDFKAVVKHHGYEIVECDDYEKKSTPTGGDWSSDFLLVRNK